MFHLTVSPIRLTPYAIFPFRILVLSRVVCARMRWPLCMTGHRMRASVLCTPARRPGAAPRGDGS